MLVSLARLCSAESLKPFEIRVIDEQTQRGVPLVELETVNHTHSFTDSAGEVAFDEPGLLGREVFFNIRSHGYEFPKDGFGFVGARLSTTPGGSVTLKIKRLNVAERLYRLTGAGIYRDTILLGNNAPISEPVLNSEVLGQDSVQCAIYRGKIYWFWGDTQRARYPLGHFRTSGATSELPTKGGLDPAVGVNFKYFTGADGFSRPMCPLDPTKPGPVWLDGLCVVPDETGRERLVAHYSRMKGFEVLEHGIVIFDDEKDRFEPLKVLDLKERFRCPTAHSMRSGDHIYFGEPGPWIRVKADLASISEPSNYERWNASGQKWERDEKPAPPKIEPADVDGGNPPRLQSGTVEWNEFRQRWIMIAVQRGGTSVLGEVWYSEARELTGPWHRAKKIATHERYSFYNPAHHPFFDQTGGRHIFFEGTYSETFSGNPVPTPRYDYNQMMYRLDLEDPRLIPARAE